MFNFDSLVSATAKVVKDFIHFCYNRARHVYYALKRWLWELQGVFAAHDAFVDMCYDAMYDVEEFEWELQKQFSSAEHDVLIAKHEFERLLKDGAPLRTWPQPCAPIGSFRSSDDFQEAAREAENLSLMDPEPSLIKGSGDYSLDNPNRIEKFINLIQKKEVLSATEQMIKHAYEEHIGEAPFGKWFNTLPSRMNYIKRAASKKAKAAKRSNSVRQMVNEVNVIPDFISICDVVQVDTGEKLPPKKDKEGELLEPEPKFKMMRRVKAEHYGDARSYIRQHIRNNNMRLIDGSDVSHATINRYALKFCEDLELDMTSTAMLVDYAMTMVPIPLKNDIERAKIVHSPAARQIRQELGVLNAEVFLEGLCSDSGFESPFSILGLPEIVVRSGATPRKSRSVISFLSQFTLGLDYQCPNPSLHNALVAVERRVFTVGKGNEVVLPYKNKPGIFSNLDYFRDSIVNKVGCPRTHTPEELAATYHSGKRSLYNAAVQSLKKKAVERSDANVTAFLKMEKHLMSKKIAPRLICPRNKRYNVELGRRLKFNEKKFMHAIDSTFESPTVLSGYDSFRVGKIIANKWSKFKRPVAIGVDASRFDQHVGVEALQWEHSIYNGAFKDPILKELLHWQTENRIMLFVEDKILKFKVKGHRMSGDINTSSGNKLIMCGMMHYYFKTLGVKAELCNNGDDCVIICERKDENKFQHMHSWFKDYGFDMQIETPVYKIGQIEFCQSKPVKINGYYRMVRKPESISKDAHSLISMASAEDVKTFMSATAQCGMILNSGVPVLDAYHKCLFKASGYKKVSQEAIERIVSFGTQDKLGLRKERVEEPITMDNRLSYWESSGVDPQTQVLVERYFDNLTVHIEPRGVKRLTPLLDKTLLSIASVARKSVSLPILSK
uniref:RNA-directed RNA polymerase n=2 Tax=Soybean dwarf virus TaxID=12049 RepID=A0A6M8PRM6_9TOMB|nr:RNA-dependent RNA polymerase P1-P2 fusion [Soybean dwarf virus]